MFILLTQIAVTASFVTAEMSYLHYAATLIEGQIEFTEKIIASSGGLHIDETAYGVTKNEFVPEKIKKMLEVNQKCYDLIRDRYNYFLERHNNILRYYLNILYLNPQEYTDAQSIIESFKEEHVKHAMEFQLFFTEELPNYFFEVAEKVGANLTEENKKSFQQAIKSSQNLNARKILNLSHQDGLDPSMMIRKNSSSSS